MLQHSMRMHQLGFRRSASFFPKELRPANERNLDIRTGLGYLLSAPFGDNLTSGAGGIRGHFRFGGRMVIAPALTGLVFIVLGIGPRRE